MGRIRYNTMAVEYLPQTGFCYGELDWISNRNIFFSIFVFVNSKGEDSQNTTQLVLTLREYLNKDVAIVVPGFWI